MSPTGKSPVKKAVKEHEERVKKVFDKRKWRQNKYSNKARVDRWKDNRQKSMKRSYLKMLNKEQKSRSRGSKMNSEDNPNMQPLGERKEPEKEQETTQESGQEKSQENRQGKKWKKGKKPEQNKSKGPSLKDTQEAFERRQKQAEAKAKRMKRNKMLSQKTRKGQPIMGNRMQLLLEQIQASQ